MSDLIFPTLPGLSWTERHRIPETKTILQTSVSGLDTAFQLWSFPRYTWKMSFDILRSSNAFYEWQSLLSFFLSVGGTAQTWLFYDWEDNSVTAQSIGTGDGSTVSFQLYRSIGQSPTVFSEPVLAINSISQITFNGVVQTPPSGGWSTSGGVIIFPSAPSTGVVIAGSYSYYWRCRFTEDTVDAEALMYQFWQMKEVKFRSIKLGSG